MYLEQPQVDWEELAAMFGLDNGPNVRHDKKLISEELNV
jgi:hypothetical protein